MGESTHIAGVVLAAGFSRRLGRPKQLLTLQGETLLERAVRTAREAALSPLYAVLNKDLIDLMEPADRALPGCTVLVNANAAEGMAASIRRGVEALTATDVAGLVLMTCDQVAMTPDHLCELYAEPGVAAGSGYAGKVGVPAYFPAKRFAELLALRGDQGARELLAAARCVPTEALALDVDTEEQFASAEAWLQEQRR